VARLPVFLPASPVSPSGFLRLATAVLFQTEEDSMQQTKSIPVIAVLFFTVSLAFAQKVRVDYDHSANFAKYMTFSWIKQPATPKDPLMQQRVITAINEQLKAKGLQLVDSNGDLAVAVNVATQEKQTLNTFYDGFGPWAWGMGGATTTVETYTEGTIVADLFDAQTKKVVWRGVATKEVSDKPEKVTQQVDKAIEKLFKNYPPTL
jgi:Domain of unknown function (DUF4136)